MNPSRSRPSRQRILGACMVIVVKAQRNGGVILAAQEAARLFSENPNCGFSENGISEHLIRLAVENRIAVDSIAIDRLSPGPAGSETGAQE